MRKSERTIRLAIIGLGNIGGAVLERLDRQPIPGLEVTALCEVREPEGPLAELIARRSLPLLREPEGLLAHHPTHVLEAATVEVAARCAPFFLERGISFITISSGGLADAGLLARLLGLCRPGGPRLIIPSGAVGGLDIARAAAEGTVRRVHLVTTKPAAALDHENGGGGAGPTILYRGTAAEAVTRFPRNINVAMSLALAGIGPERTTVEIIADPAATENIHRITIEGDFGTAEITLKNLPSPANPRTSLLAIQSVLATLRRLTSGVLIGY